ncbi:MAG: TIGR01906 family membrane protein [Erysipelotrichaceae bacterium]|nr:TIGR01906 family membrane protein [Erysipelotrichaceae bacterium]
MKATARIIFAVTLIMTLFISVITFYCVDTSYYISESEKLNTKQVLKMSKEDLDQVCVDLVDYLKGDLQDLNSKTYTIDGQAKNFYNDKEIAHMSDVKDLYQGVVLARNILAIVCLFALAYLIFKRDQNTAYLTANTYQKVFLIMFGVFIIVIAYAFIDFNRFWIGFHRMFFTNELWLLDPRTDLLINLMPEPFFFDIVFRIIVTEIVAFVLLYLLSVRVKKIHA